MANGGERPISEFEDILRLIRPFGRWQISACILAAFTGMFTSFFVLIHSFVGTKVPHYCRVPELSSIDISNNAAAAISASNWTELQRREFSIPPKIASHPPAIGQPFQPCKSFDIDYAQYSQLDYTAAWLKRIMDDPAPTVTDPCRDGWEFNTTNSQYPSSVQIEWKLTCHNSYLLPLSQSIFMIGFLFGVLLSGALSDAYGRKRILVYAAVMGVIFSFLTAAAPTYTTYVLARFVCAFSLASAYTIGFVLCMEIIGPAQRSLVGFAYQLPWTCGYLILPCAAYVVRNWRWLHAVLAAPCCLMLTYHWLLPESPRWLILRGFVVEARVELERAAKRNGVILPSKLPLKEMHRQQVAQQQREAVRRLNHRVSIPITPQPTNKQVFDSFLPYREKSAAGNGELGSEHNTTCVSEAAVIENETPRSNAAPALHALGLRRQFWLMWHGLSSLFTYRRIRRRTFIQYFIWFVNSIVYYGLAFYSTRLEGHLYLNFFLGGAVELPAYAAGYFTFKHFGRRLPLLCSMILGGAACFAVSIMSMCDVMSTLPITTLALSIFGKFCITASFGMIYIYSSELFPTMLRNVGLGSCSTMARVGSAIAPFVLRLGDNMWHPLPMLVFGSLAIISGISVLLLPETWHAQLPETVEAAENFGVRLTVREEEKRSEFFSRNRRNFFSSGDGNSDSACKLSTQYAELHATRPTTAGSPMTIPDESATDEEENRTINNFVDEVRSGAFMPSPNALQQSEFLKSNPQKQLEPPQLLFTASPNSVLSGRDSRIEVRSGAAMPSPDVVQQNEFDRTRNDDEVAVDGAPNAVLQRQHHPRSSIFSPHVPYTRHNVRNPTAADIEAAVKRRLSKAFVAANKRNNSDASFQLGSGRTNRRPILKSKTELHALRQHELDSIERSFEATKDQQQPKSGKLMGNLNKTIPVINIIRASGSAVNMPPRMASRIGGDTVDNAKKRTELKGANERKSSVGAVSWKIYQDSPDEGS